MCNRLLTLSALGYALAGCGAELAEVDGVVRIAFDETTRRILVAVPMALVLGSLGLAAFKPSRVLGLGLAAAVGGFSVLIIPGVLQDEVVMDEVRIVQRTGFWFAPTVKGFAYREVERVRIVQRQDRKGRPQVIWELHRPGGRVDALDPGDLWEHNSELIIPRLVEKHGVLVD